ncbi:MAG: GAK system XXXCH domain-containing protein [Humidesulfovibrio sp.]|nr:GAK system XXXCH domain-containing protein [Humidesulfovibrio sp.]
MSAWRLETDVSEADLPRLLRLLANALEAGPAEATGPLTGFPPEVRALELFAERSGAGYALTLKARRAVESHASAHDAGGQKTMGHARETDAAERAREKYRQLKKLMQADYKVLQKAAEAGTLPAPEVLESFLALCDSMADIVQPLLAPRGLEAKELALANRSFVEEARALRRAVSARDVAALAEVLARLERRKSACHVQFR